METSCARSDTSDFEFTLRLLDPGDGNDDLPLHELGRRAATDLEMHGRTIPEGCPVGLDSAAANRDGAEFPDPDEFDPTRSANRHLASGHGVHKCLGAPPARLEIRVVLEELLARTASIEPAGEAMNDLGLVGGVLHGAGPCARPRRVTGRR